MKKENRLVDYEPSNQESIAENYHESSDWQTELVIKRLAEANSGGEGLDHSKLFSQIKLRLEAKT